MTRRPSNRLLATVPSRIQERGGSASRQRRVRLLLPALAEDTCPTPTPLSAVAPAGRTAVTTLGVIIAVEKTTSGSGSRRGCGRISARGRCWINIPYSVDSRRPAGPICRRRRSRQRERLFRRRLVHQSREAHKTLHGKSDDERRCSDSQQSVTWAESPSHDIRVTEPLAVVRNCSDSSRCRHIFAVDTCAAESSWRNCFHPCMFRPVNGPESFVCARPAVPGAPIWRPTFSRDGTPCALPDRVFGALTYRRA